MSEYRSIMNKIAGALVVLVNVYFLPYTLRTMVSGVNSVLPLIIPINLLLVTTALTFVQRLKDSRLLLAINIAGLLWAGFILWLMFSTVGGLD